MHCTTIDPLAHFSLVFTRLLSMLVFHQGQCLEKGFSWIKQFSVLSFFMKMALIIHQILHERQVLSNYNTRYAEEDVWWWMSIMFYSMRIDITVFIRAELQTKMLRDLDIQVSQKWMKMCECHPTIAAQIGETGLPCYHRGTTRDKKYHISLLKHFLHQRFFLAIW